MSGVRRVRSANTRYHSRRKSAISYSGRISISLGPGIGLEQSFTQANRLAYVLDFPEPEAGDKHDADVDQLLCEMTASKSAIAMAR
jgi:hypothetical protein